MLKTTSICIGVALLGLTAAYSADTASTNDWSARTNHNKVHAISPTSRETNTSTRIYAPEGTNSASKDVDNTGRNVRDRSNATLTPGDQANNKTDIETTRRIRRALTANSQLSTSAKNIKIITTNGKITLRGPVKTPQEQEAIFSAAKGVAGDSSVDNQLEVKAVNQ